jgi:hypothetical protein
MRSDEKQKIVTSAIRGAVIVPSVVAAAGLANVTQYVFFGMIATGTVLSAPVLLGAAVGGGALFTVGAAAKMQLDKRASRRAYEDMVSEESKGD